MEDQFLQERRHIHYKTPRRQIAAKLWQEIKSSHRNLSGHAYGVRRVRRNPDRTQRRRDPNTLLRAQRHHSARSKQQLVFRMGVLGDHVAVSEVSRYACYLGNKSPLGSTKYALALVRHFLSHYRDKNQGATAIFRYRKSAC